MTTDSDEIGCLFKEGSRRVHTLFTLLINETQSPTLILPSLNRNLFRYYQ